MDLHINKFYLILFSIFLIFSCSSKKDIVYFQNLDGDSTENFSLNPHVIGDVDILKISVKTQNPENLISISETATSPTINQNRESLIYSVGYNIDKDGFINFPELGKIKATGFTVHELSNIISSKLNESNILINPIVDVKVLNRNFTIIGEVKNPGKYYFDEEINILQAIGMAGDLTITGKRDDIKMIRFYNNSRNIYNIDLTDSALLNQDFFQVYSGDILIVNPNTTKVKNAGIIGNSGTLLSLLSFLLSSIIIINR